MASVNLDWSKKRSLVNRFFTIKAGNQQPVSYPSLCLAINLAFIVVRKGD